MSKKNSGIFILLILFCVKSFAATQTSITISSAISLKTSLDEITSKYNQKNNIKFLINYGASGSLKRQIQNGAPVDIVLFADKNSADELVVDGILEKKDIYYPIYNSLILVGYKKISNINQLQGKLAIGESNIVPLGNYSKEFLTNISLYEKLKPNIIFGKDAKAVQTYVETEAVDYAIIYKNELTSLKNSSLILELDKNKYSKPTYTFAIIRSRATKDTQKFFEYLLSDECKKIFVKNGFEI
ncbi:MAG: molybdate ABC transporter substrate-binding protein [Fusobacteriaceae bacterium]